MYGTFVWARRALNHPKRWFPARAGEVFKRDGVAGCEAALRKIFHRPPSWFVTELYIHHSARRQHCTAFVTFDSEATPAEVIGSHRASYRSCAMLRNTCSALGYVFTCGTRGAR